MARQVESPTDAEVDRIASRAYARILIPDLEDGGYLARVLEFPSCISDGDTPDEAIANIEDALRGIIAVMLEHNTPIPEPLSGHEYSGRLNLRIPPSLHARAAERAALEGVSLNRLLSDAIAQQVGGRMLGSELEEPSMDTALKATCLVRLLLPSPPQQVLQVVVPHGGYNPEIAGDILALQAYYEARGTNIAWDTVRPDENTWENEEGLPVRYVHAGVDAVIEIVAYDKQRDVYYIYDDFEATEVRAEVFVLAT